MKSHLNKISGNGLGDFLKITGGLLAASIMMATPVVAADFSYSGESKTILRMGKDIDNKNIYPAYEYLRLAVTTPEKDGSSISFFLGGWGRVDLADKSERDRRTDADLQYGYLSYRGAKNNLVINAGRQFITEGVATERIDGFYARNDFLGGLSAAVFAGNEVVTEPNFKGDNFVFGGRITQSNYKYYTIGLSALKSFDASGGVYREEEGADIWLHPLKQVDLTGRSSYNSVTNGWMEHAYTLSYSPLDNLRLSADFSDIRYRDYFYRVTTSALSLNNGIIDPREEVLTAGGMVSYSPIKDLTLAADYKNYRYDFNKSNADYFGGKVSYLFPGDLLTGFAIHRMDGSTDRLRYQEYRLFASKKIAHFDLALDLMDVVYDRRINGMRSAVTVVGAAGYEFTENLKVGADIDYSHNPDFDTEVKGLVKLIYAFDSNHAAEGRSKSEKH